MPGKNDKGTLDVKFSVPFLCLPERWIWISLI